MITMSSYQDESGESTPTTSASAGKGATGRSKKETTSGLLANDLAMILAALKAQNNAPTLDSVAQTMIHYEQVGRNLRPNLLADGSNFPDWAPALNLKVQGLFDETDYYLYTTRDESASRAKITGTIVEYSIDPSLSPFVAAKPGREAFHILKERFGSVSWSYLMSKWSKLFQVPDVTVNPNKTYNELKLALQAIEQHMGGFTLDGIVAFSLHFNAQHAYQDISNALDSRIAIDKRIRISSKDVLELISQNCTPQNDIPPSALMSYSTKPL